MALLQAKWLTPLLGAGASIIGVGLLLGARCHPATVRHLPRIDAHALLPGPSASAPPSPASGAPSADPAPSGPPRFADDLDVTTFQKGNIHTHTTFSDGDRPPQDVYRWYKERGYNFLAITDHNTLTDPAVYRLLERKKRFVMISGEEVTMWGAGKQVHVNALCHKHTIGGKKFDTQREALAWAVKEIAAQGGVALVNHPNWDWSLTAADLPAAHGAKLLEIWSGHPHVHTLGDDTHLSHEAIWDTAFSAGEDFAGVAIDDAHSYGPHAPDNAARPGRAWIYAFAAEPTHPLVCEALAQGRLYASTGATLKRISIHEDTYAVYPADANATVEFVGKDGRVLESGKAGSDGAVRYRIKGGEGYVRARLTGADGKRAWTQPSRVTG